MTESINQKLREYYLKDKVLDTIYKLDTLDKNQKEAVLSLFVCDYYKMKFYEAASNFDMCEIGNLQSQTIDDYLFECDDDAIFLCEIISNAKEFYSLSNLSKILLLETLSTWGQDKKLLELSKFHIYDAIAYNFNSDLDCLSAYYYDFKNGKNLDGEDFQTIIINKLNELAITDEKKYSQTILQYVKEFYKWTNFTYRHFGEESLYELDRVYLNLIEIKDLNYIVNLTKKNFDFLLTLVDSYMYHMDSIGEDNISKSIVDEYYDNETSETIKNKFKKRTN